MHQRERARRELGEAADRRAHAGVEAGILEQVLRRDRRPDDVALGQRRAVAELGEQVAAQQGPRRLLVQHAGVPAMRRMRRVDEADALAAAEVDHFAVLQHARRAVGEVVERHHAAGLAVRRRRLRRDREPFVHRAALVGLEMAEGDPAQALGRDDAADARRG